MRLAFLSFPSFYALVLTGAVVALAGCGRIPGRPGPGPEVSRPEAVLDFATLYKANCAACHGEDGRGGAAIALANPVYLAVAGEDNLREITAKGVSGKLMPPFAKSAGAMLTDQQIEVIPEYTKTTYRAKMEAHIEQLRSRTRGAGMDYRLLVTDQPLDEALREYLSLRQAGN